VKRDLSPRLRGVIPALAVAGFAALGALALAVMEPSAVDWSGVPSAAAYGFILGVVGTVISADKPGQDGSRIPAAIRSSSVALGVWLAFGMVLLQAGRAWVDAGGQTPNAVWWFARCVNTCAILLAASLATLLFEQFLSVGGSSDE